jgi:hypothetical protein
MRGREVVRMTVLSERDMQATGVWSLQPLADMSAAEFRDWQALLEDRTGVVVNEQRRAFLQTSLGAHARTGDRRLRQLLPPGHRWTARCVGGRPC